MHELRFGVQLSIGMPCAHHALRLAAHYRQLQLAPALPWRFATNMPCRDRAIAHAVIVRDRGEPPARIVPEDERARRLAGVKRAKRPQLAIPVTQLVSAIGLAVAARTTDDECRRYCHRGWPGCAAPEEQCGDERTAMAHQFLRDCPPRG